MVILGICQPVDLNVHVGLKDGTYLNKLRKIFDTKWELCTSFVMTYKDTLCETFVSDIKKMLNCIPEMVH